MKKNTGGRESCETAHAARRGSISAVRRDKPAGAAKSDPHALTPPPATKSDPHGLAPWDRTDDGTARSHLPSAAPTALAAVERKTYPRHR